MYPNIYKSLVLVTFLLSLAQTNANVDEEEKIQNQLTEIVQLNGGQVQGVIRETNNGNKINFFQGIRFGRAKRFSRSTPVEPWTGQIYDATQKKAVCPQPGIGQPMMPDSSEDCLFLNVWQPTTEPTKNQTLRSVMVWIHGGGFFAWSINSFDAIRFAEIGDLVVVSLNYRLGPLGFLGFDTEEEPGNLGLHDQILGLKWIQENIELFGGNPRDVTVFGESAGAISIGALILSPLTSGLFHRAILQSGSPLVEQFVESKQNSLHKTIEFAERMNCRKANHVLTMKCLRETPLVDLIQSAMVDFYNLRSFVPIHDDELLPLAPAELLKQPLDRKPLDLMFGVTRDEGTLLISQTFPEINMDQLTPESARNAMQIILDRLKIHDTDNLIVDYYSKDLNNQTTLDELRFAVSNVFGDYLLTCPTILFGQKLAHFSRARSTGSHFYAYRLMTSANLTVPKHLESKFPKWLGISHGSDLVFQFDVPYFGARLEKNNEQFELVSRHMIEAWTQFAKTGQISPVSGVEWTEALDPSQNSQSSSVKYFSIDPTDYKMVENYWSDICDRIWEPILMKTTRAKSAKTEL